MNSCPTVAAMQHRAKLNQTEKLFIDFHAKETDMEKPRVHFSAL